MLVDLRLVSLASGPLGRQNIGALPCQGLPLADDRPFSRWKITLWAVDTEIVLLGFDPNMTGIGLSAGFGSSMLAGTEGAAEGVGHSPPTPLLTPGHPTSIAPRC